MAAFWRSCTLNRRRACSASCRSLRPDRQEGRTELMRFEYDKDAGAVYVYLQEIPDGAAVHTEELEPGVYLDADEEGRVLGVEFLDMDFFWKHMERNGGRLNVPDRLDDMAKSRRASGLSRA